MEIFIGNNWEIIYWTISCYKCVLEVILQMSYGREDLFYLIRRLIFITKIVARCIASTYWHSSLMWWEETVMCLLSQCCPFCPWHLALPPSIFSKWKQTLLCKIFMNFELVCMNRKLLLHTVTHLIWAVQLSNIKISQGVVPTLCLHDSNYRRIRMFSCVFKTIKIQ